MLGVIAFIRTDYIRNIPGTAHRPFPTVSLQRSTFAPIVPTMRNVVAHLVWPFAARTYGAIFF